MSVQNISKSSFKSQEEKSMDMEELVNVNNFSQCVTQIDIQAENGSILGRSSCSYIHFEPNEDDEEKRFGRAHVEVDGKRVTLQNIRTLIKEKVELKKHIAETKKSCRKLTNQIKAERNKCQIRRQDLRTIRSLLQKYSED